MGEDASDRIKRLVLERDKLRSENEALRARVIADGELWEKSVAEMTKLLDDNAMLRAALKEIATEALPSKAPLLAMLALRSESAEPVKP